MQIALSVNQNAAKGERIDVFALAGQSNMVGEAIFDDGAGFTQDVRQLGQTGAATDTLIPAAIPLDHSSANGGTFGPWLSFAIDRLAARPDTGLVLVPCAASGASFHADRWNPGDDRAQNLVADLTAMATQHPSYRLAGVLWHQGESDAQPIADGFQTAADYEAALDGLIAHVRSTVPGAAKLPWILGRLAPSFLTGGSSARNAAAAEIDAVIADTPNRVAHTAVVSADGLTTTDNTHFDAASVRTLGSRYAVAVPVASAHAPDLTAPTITSPTAHTVASGAAEVATLTADEPVTWAIIGGADAARFTLSTGGDLAFAAAEPAGSYAVSVRATDGAGHTADAALIITVSAAPATLPGAVTGLMVTPGDTQNALTWTAPADNGGCPVTDYVTEVDDGTGFTALSDGVSAATTHTHGGLVNGTPYSYRVAAVNGVGTGPGSATVSATPPAPSGPAAEAAAAGHWLLGDDNTAHADLVSSQTLTATNTQPTSGSGFVSFAHNAGNGNGLLSPLLDDGAFTFAAVVRVPSNRTLMFGGSLTSAGSDKGFALWMSGGNLVAKARGRQNTVAAMPTGEWRVVAVSVDGGNAIVATLGDASAPTTITDTGTGAAPVRAISAGEVHWGDSLFNDGFDMAELIIWKSALSATDLAAVRNRSAARLSARGLTLG